MLLQGETLDTALDSVREKAKDAPETYDEGASGWMVELISSPVKDIIQLYQAIRDERYCKESAGRRVLEVSLKPNIDLSP